MNEPEILFLIDNIPEEILLKVKTILENYKLKKNIPPSKEAETNEPCPSNKPFTSNDPDCRHVELHSNEMIITKDDLARLQKDNVDLFNHNQKLIKEINALNKKLKESVFLYDGECVIKKKALEQLRETASLSVQYEDLSRTLQAALAEQALDVKYLKTQLTEANEKIKIWMKHSEAQVEKLLTIKRITDTV